MISTPVDYQGIQFDWEYCINVILYCTKGAKQKRLLIGLHRASSYHGVIK